MSSNNPRNTEDTRISWHPAFLEAMRLELEPYRNQLEFLEEHQLTSEPLRVDLLIIKKPKDLVIEAFPKLQFLGDKLCLSSCLEFT